MAIHVIGKLVLCRVFTVNEELEILVILGYHLEPSPFSKRGEKTTMGGCVKSKFDTVIRSPPFPLLVLEDFPHCINKPFKYFI